MSNFNVNHLGADNFGADKKALFLKVFANETLAAFNANCIYQDKQIVRNIDHGKSAQFPVFGRIGAEYHTPGTELLGLQMPHSERVITIDDKLVSHVTIPDVYEAHNHYDVRGQYTRQMGAALANAYDKNVSRNIVLAARSSGTITGEAGGSVINGGTNVKTDGDLIKKAIFTAAQILDEKDVPEQSRYCIFAPVTYYVAVQNKDLINRDFDGDGSISKGVIGTVAGISIAKSNHVPQTDESALATIPLKYRGDYSKTAFQIFHDTSVGTVKLMDLASQMGYDITRQATIMVSSYAIGHGILRPESAIEVTTNP